MINKINKKEKDYKLDPELYSEEPNEICKDCIFWKNFKHECHFYWYRKKYCSMKVSDNEKFEETKNLIKINKTKKNSKK